MECGKRNVFDSGSKPAIKGIKIIASCYDEFCISGCVVKEMLDECFKFRIFYIIIFVQTIFKIVEDH